MTTVRLPWLCPLAFGLSLGGCVTKPDSPEATASTQQSIWRGTPAVNLPIVGLEWDDYRPIEPPGPDGKQIDPCTNQEGVPKPDPDVPDFAWCEKFSRCSGTFIAEHWILTAAHCGPHYRKAKSPGGQWQITTRDEGKPRHFRAGVEQKHSENWKDFCLGPRDRSGQRAAECKLEISAYPYSIFQTAEEGVIDTEAAAAEDLALWFLASVWPLAVNIDEKGQVIEPEQGAKPIAAKPLTKGTGSDFGYELTPWGWGSVGSSAEPAPDLHRPPNAGIVLGDLQLFDESFASNIKSPAPSPPDARICGGDSGGPLLGNVGWNADGSAIQAIFGVNARATPGPNDCPLDGGLQRFARVDTPKKRAWIEEQLQRYPANPKFVCRNQVGSREYMECWRKRCTFSAPSSGCSAGETCLPQGFTFGRSLTNEIETHPPRFRADRCEP
jgi:hypothetical protein